MKLKKRLPALFLALFLALSPLMLAVPARASVLDEQLPVFAFEGSLLALPMNDLPYCVVLCETTFGFTIFHVVYSSTPFIISVEAQTDTRSRVIVSGSDCIVYRSSGIYSWDPFVPTFPAYGSGVEYAELYSELEHISFCGFTSGVLIIGDYDPYTFIEVPISWYQPVGMLSVFTRVGSWFSGAVNNLISMFYTAESGLTVLGVLAVASLALAFILLLLYLIAGWLKFR